MPHTTHATHLLSLEAPIETVSKLPEHADIKTTQIYAKVIDKNKREVVDKLGTFQITSFLFYLWNSKLFAYFIA